MSTAMPHRQSRTRRISLPVCLCGAALLAGCDMLIPLALMQHKEKVPAEFDKLGGKRTAIVIWAPQETLFDYPHVRMELALHVADRILANVKTADIVDGRKIEDHLERTLSITIDPEEIGRTFDCDYVVYLELIEFQVRDPDAPDYLRATIESSVTVFDMRVDPDQPRRYPLTDVKAVYPENAPLMFTETNAAVVRKQAYEQFGEQVARKFYDHEVEM